MSSSDGLLVLLEATEGKEQELSHYLIESLESVAREHGSSSWYAFRINHSQFGIYDTFPSEQGRQAQRAEKVAEKLGARAEGLLASPPKIQPLEVLASK
ncbi:MULTISPECIES: putative quinol monooxygenase [unclassified Mycolicibacterium]|uniref:putative quinol monooxygenase n=1 Tax=unclassified Mycolicibacterium TaxID=2636767 RepID=UPI002ED8BCE5